MKGGPELILSQNPKLNRNRDGADICFLLILTIHYMDAEKREYNFAFTVKQTSYL